MKKMVKAIGLIIPTIIIFSVHPGFGINTSGVLLTEEGAYERWKASLVSPGRFNTMSPDALLAFPDITTSDSYVDERIDSNESGYIGAWVEGGRPNPSGSYMKILYGYPDGIWTSWVHLNVDGNVYSNRNDVPGVPYFPVIRTYPRNRAPDPGIFNPTGQTNETVWEAGGVRFTQMLTPCRLHPNSGTIFYQYKIENISGTAHNVGVLLFFDTMINNNDAARISTAYGYNNYQQDFRAPNIPQYWQAYEGPGLAGFVAQGDVIGYNAVMPDRLCIVYWPDIYGDVAWDYNVPVGSTYGDSAMLLYWGWRSGSSYPTHYLPPGGSWVVGTYLGTGGVDTGELSVVANYPSFACIGCRGINPSTFNIDLTVINTGTRNATDVQAQIVGSLPYPLILMSSNPVYTTPRNIPVSGTGICSFTIRIDNPTFAMGNTYSFDIRVSSSDPGIPANTVHITLTFPNCSTVGPSATVIRPSPCDGITSCANQDIQIQITGTYGVDPSTIRLIVNGVEHRVGDSETFFSQPILTFRPRTNWTDGQLVTFTLTQASDTTGCLLQAPVSCSFRVDLSPPEISDPNPPAGSIVTTSEPDISVRIHDAISGVNPGSIVPQVRVNGVIWDRSMYNVFWDGSLFHIRDATFSNNDLVEICILDATDSPTYNYCPPNHIRLPYCWSFRVILDTEGPVATIIEPLPNTYSACIDQQIIMRITDAISRVDPRSIELTVDGLPYNVDGVSLIYTDSTLIWRPRPGFYTNGQIVNVCLTRANDIYGNPLQHAPVCWQFTMDFTPPALYNFSPPLDGTITDSLGIISLSIIDSLSGVDSLAILLTIDGRRYNYPGGFSYAGGTITWTPTTPWAEYDTILVCIEARDRVRYCEPNDTNFCYTLYVDRLGPQAELIEPQPNTYTTCADQRIAIILRDPGGIDPTRGSIVVNGVRYFVPSSNVHIVADTLIFTPTTNFSDGETVSVVFDEAYDIYGNPVQDTLVWRFIVDLSPPEIFGVTPPHGSVVSDTRFTASCLIWDRLSGLNTARLLVTVDGVVVPFSSTMIGESLMISYSPAVPYDPIDTVLICLESVEDFPDYCPPNSRTFCWTVYVDALGPVATVIEPLNETYTACINQQLVIVIHDENGVDTNSVYLRIQGEVFDTSDHRFTWRADTLIFTPPDTFWHDAETIYVELGATDIFGNRMQNEPLRFLFYTDFTPPVISNLEPLPGSTVTSASPLIRATIRDAMSGVDPSHLIVEINGETYSASTPGFSFDTYSGQLELDLNAVPVAFRDGDSVNICIRNVMDNPDYCPPNVVSDYCWYFHVALLGPRATLLVPFNHATTTCADQEIRILLEDREGIDSTTIVLEVGVNRYTIGSPELMLVGDTLIFRPGRPIWADGTLVRFTLIDARDILGNPLQGAPISWDFTVDLSPPVVIDPNPPSGALVSSRNPIISFRLYDQYSGLDTTNVAFVIGGLTLHRGDAGVTMLGENVRIDCRAAGLIFSPEDTVSICVTAQDAPDFCPPNTGTTCWQFIISLSGPWATIIEPLDSTFTACDNQRIIIAIEDANGINASTIRLEINGSLYTTTSPEISWRSDTLIFTPSRAWRNGEIVSVRLISADDNLGNPLENPLEYIFFVDLSPPVQLNIAPLAASVINDPTPIISVMLADSTSGIDTASLQLHIGDHIYRLRGDSGTTWTWELSTLVSDGYFVLDAESAGIRFSHNDSVTICVSAADMPDYCPPNILNYCWYFSVDLVGPLALPITPQPGEISSCEDQEIRILLLDSPISHGVNFSTVVLRVNGIDYAVGSPELSRRGDTLVFTPTTMWENNEEVTVEIAYAEDNLGNPLAAPLRYSFFIDTQPPTIFNEYPAQGAELERRDPVLRFTIRDNLAGTVLDSVSVSVSVSGNPIPYRFNLVSPYFTRRDSTFALPFGDAGIILEGGDTARICVHAFDQPEICSPNVTDSCWYFVIPPGGPRLQVITPQNNTYFACHFGEIVFRVFDPNGVDWNTLRITINSDTISYGDIRISRRGDTLIYTPTEDWVDGEYVRVCLISALDSIGNPIDSTSCWGFTIDFTPPEVRNTIPVGIVRVRYPTISADISDRLSGLNRESIYVLVNSDTLRLGHPGVSFDGTRISINPQSAGIYMRGGDNFRVCVHSADSPDYCEPNVRDTCWNFQIEPGGPVASIISPQPRSLTACNPTDIIISLIDSNGIVDSTIRLVVDGVTYTTSSGYLTYSGGRLTFNHGTGFFADEDTVHVQLVSAEDMLGNPLSTPLDWTFFVDYHPPVYWNESPARASSVETTNPVISFNLADSVAGLDSARVRVRINGTFYDLTNPACSFDGTRFTFVPESLGIEWRGGTTVEVCPEAYDTPDYCEPNRLFDCYTFTIARGGPRATIIEPLPNTFSACDSQGIILTLEDRNGVDSSTIILVVQGDTFTVSDPELWFEYPYLRFTPDPPFGDGETVYVSLVDARDMLHNQIDSVTNWRFVMDLTPPAISNITPEPDSIVAVRQPHIMFHLEDALSGIDEASIRVRIDTVTLIPGETGTSWDGSNFIFYPESLDMEWRGGQHIDICVEALDLPNYCAPNVLDTCWTVYIATGGPIATVLEPLNRTTSTCPNQRVIVNLYDRDGVNPSTIRLMIDSTLYTLDSTAVLAYRNDSLIFTPRMDYWRDADTVFVSLVSAEDNLGNPLERAPVSWWFRLDFSPPVLVRRYPENLMHISNWQDIISGELFDQILGVDSTSVNLTLTGIFMHPAPATFSISNGVQWRANSFSFNPRNISERTLDITYPPQLGSYSGLYFPEFDTIRVSLYVADRPPDYCFSNSAQYDWSFIVADDDTVPPRFSNFSPTYYSWNREFYISVIATDTSGIYDSLAYLVWDNDGSVDDGSCDTVILVIDSLIDAYSCRLRTLVPIPPQPLGANFVYRVYAYDNDFDFLNPIDRKLGYAESVVSIMEGPHAEPVEPLPSTITACSDQRIIIRLMDPDGVNPSSISLQVNDSVYSVDGFRLTYYNDSLLVFTPDSGFFHNNEVVRVALLSASDNLGNPRFDTLRYTFSVDLEPPRFVFSYPGDSGMVHDKSTPIEIIVTDNLSGVNPSSIVLTANGTEYTVGNGLRLNGDRLVFTPNSTNAHFQAGDTVFISLRVSDSPDYCAANVDSDAWIYVIEPSVPCGVRPNPFTPNDDGYNDFVVFDYPNMFSADATVIIYDRWNREIWRKNFSSIRDFYTILPRSWDGKDKNGRVVEPGVYIYLVKVRGEVVCSGTITVAR